MRTLLVSVVIAIAAAVAACRSAAAPKPVIANKSIAFGECLQDCNCGE